MPAMVHFSELEVWIDPIARVGVENMAVDECLFMEGLAVPLLRFYQWSRAEVSFGYFEKLTDAQAAFPGDGLHYVRRWTGGGIVDHRVDQTYTLFLPKGHRVEQLRGNESYELIHQALAASLDSEGVPCELTIASSDSDARSCFVKPVPFDIVSPEGRKLAGAGQKRSKYGMMHQGSVQGVVDVASWREAFASALSDAWKRKDIAESELGNVSSLVIEKYGTKSWLEKRI